MNTITEKEILLLCRRANAGKEVEWPEESLLITSEQFNKGLKWLKNQWKAPHGAERKNNPFGFREQEAIEKADHMTFDGYYDAGNAHHRFYVPLYSVVGKEDSENYLPSFQYYCAGGKINIVG